MANTPMIQQYLQIKEQTEDCILFFRLGDFYEMFFEDANLVSRELDLALTTRDRNKPKEKQTPMCGIPYHSSEAYIARLIAKGYKVAICEQTEDPAQAKGLVRREVVRIITPGTVIDASMLDERRNNYISAVYMDEAGAGVCFADVSTGEVYLTHITGKNVVQRILGELGRFVPSEILLGGLALPNDQIGEFLRVRIQCLVEDGEKKGLFERDGAEVVLGQFKAEKLSELGLEKAAPAVRCAAGLLLYLYQTQKTDLSHLSLNVYSQGRFMELDMTARRNLELTETLRGQERRGSLIWVLDRTRTPMGGRLIRSWIENPLVNPAEIRRRQEVVQVFYSRGELAEQLAELLSGTPDAERLISRIVYGTGGGRDLRALSQSAARLPTLRGMIEGLDTLMMHELYDQLDDLSDLRDLIDNAVCDAPPFSVREGGIIREGYNEEVDRLRFVEKNTRQIVADMERTERERTGIKKLKISFNKNFGYYIEVSNANVNMVPEGYIRKQTLVNCERYVTAELKEMENTILTAQERLAALEYDLFVALRQQVAAQVHRVQRSAQAVAQLDVLLSFAEAARENRYCQPEVDYTGVIAISEGRHPVVEQIPANGLFVPNDADLNTDHPVAIITGPNMAGKSTYMRQVALITLMAQMGSFVPAKSARIGIADRIFTRIGASDDLAGGRSTFMVEMTEVAEILSNATAKSLVILDEIGRGTSTFDGMAIARAVLEYVADKKRLGARTLFATHYHELTVLEQSLDGVVNYNVAVKKRGDEIIFLRKIVRGGADDSYGVEVARLAGIPDQVVRRARDVLITLEAGAGTEHPQTAPPGEEGGQVSLEHMKGEVIAQKLRDIDLNTISPIEAMNLLFELQKQAKN